MLSRHHCKTWRRRLANTSWRHFQGRYLEKLIRWGRLQVSSRRLEKQDMFVWTMPIIRSSSNLQFQFFSRLNKCLRLLILLPNLMWKQLTQNFSKQRLIYPIKSLSAKNTRYILKCQKRICNRSLFSVSSESSKIHLLIQVLHICGVLRDLVPFV